MATGSQNAKVSPQSNPVRPVEVGMKIHTGMLESLGINMYTSIGKSLVEFIANGFDAEASIVKVTIPFQEIETARTSLKNAKKEGESKQQSGQQAIYEALPDHITIVIEDNGHGMTVQQLEDKFLIVNRNRRKAEGDKSEGGLRTVMGRKGLGKLAGFGVAEQVIVRTKRKNETYATTIVMDFNKIKESESVSEVKFSPEYEDGLDKDESGTKITLRKLRCDSLKSKEDYIGDTLAKNFYITGGDFKILLNGNVVQDPDIDYEFLYPSDRDANGFGTIDVNVSEGFNYPVLYVVKFRARSSDVKDGRIRGPLSASMRGARVYCNQRLAAGPTLFNLPTGIPK